MVKIQSSFPPLSETEIREFEEKIGHPLPEPYRNFLLKHNGGSCWPDTFKYQMGDLGEQYDGVGIFLGIIDEKERNAIIRQKRLLGDELPAHLLPIADDQVGNNLCISIFGNDVGKVFFWKHGLDETWGNPFFVANDFDEFLNTLQEFPEDNE